MHACIVTIYKVGPMPAEVLGNEQLTVDLHEGTDMMMHYRTYDAQSCYLESIKMMMQIT